MERGKKKKLIGGFALLLILIILLVFFYLDFSSKNMNTNVIEEVLCSETDNGIDYVVQGVTTGITIDYPIVADYEDVCLSEESLEEFSCENDMVIKEKYNCSLDKAVCFEGMCLEEEDPEEIICNDTDGLNYSNAGSVYGQLVPEGVPTTKYDSCNSTETLVEYLCEDNLIVPKSIDCESVLNGSVCEFGACVIENSSYSPPEINCTSSGNFCVDNSSICSGNILNFSCSEIQVCCDVDPNLQNSSSTCLELNGTVCNSTQYCFQGDHYNSLGLESGQVCCVDGNCTEIQISQNNNNYYDNFLIDNEGGSSVNLSCIGDSCEGNENSQVSTTTCGPEEDCGVEKSFSKQNYWWLWLVGGIIVLGGLVLIFFNRGRVKPQNKLIDLTENSPQQN